MGTATMVSASECRRPDLGRLLPEWEDHVSAVVGS